MTYRQWRISNAFWPGIMGAAFLALAILGWTQGSGVDFRFGTRWVYLATAASYFAVIVWPHHRACRLSVAALPVLAAGSRMFDFYLTGGSHVQGTMVWAMLAFTLIYTTTLLPPPYSNGRAKRLFADDGTEQRG